MSDELPKARNPAWAGLLSLLVPGFGQLYNGRVRLGVACWMACVGFALGMPFVWAAVLTWGFWAVAGVFILALLVRLAIVVQACVDAPRCSGRAGAPWWSYLLLVGMSVSFKLFLAPLWTAVIPIHSLAIPSGSMMPTLVPGDYVLADYRRPYVPHNGDLLVYQDEMGTYIKRVAAIGGQRVAIQDGQLLVDGQVVPTVWPEPVDSDFPELLVPVGHYFLLGDNINNSRDSRFSGSIPADWVLGRAVYRFWGTEIGTRF